MRVILTTLHSKFIHNSLALPCIASYCAEGCGEILIREYTVHEPKESTLSALLAEQPDIVAFSVYIWNRHETFELIDLLATINPDLKLVVGGPEVSFDDPQLFTKHPGLTALVHGEGEMPMRGLLEAWAKNEDPENVPRLTWRQGDKIVEGASTPPIEVLDTIPSPFQSGMVDASRGFVYYESSRGCPYNCSFCMSALDATVRSYSTERIEADLVWLIDQKVPKIKLVDRTFNYDAGRALRIFKFILDRNVESHFHFEIGAHLLDEETLQLLETVPEGMFHFEIGVQSTLPETLTAIDRKVSMQKVLHNIRELKKRCRIELHLDLIAGLPGESYQHFIESINLILALEPDHLQIEPVKLLPGSPLRRSAKTQNLRHDPNPPYTVVASDSLTFNELEQLKAISRLLDLTWNSGRLKGFMQSLSQLSGSTARAFEILALHLQNNGLFRLPLSQNGLFEAIWSFVNTCYTEKGHALLKESLARDYALCERVIPAKTPDFFEPNITITEQNQIREIVQKRQIELRGTNTKLQYYAAPFSVLSPESKREIRLFLYLTRSGQGRAVEEIVLPSHPACNDQL